MVVYTLEQRLNNAGPFFLPTEDTDFGKKNHILLKKLILILVGM